jgi:ABC-type glutathione transport system ATPase component
MTLLAIRDLRLELDGVALLHGVDVALERGERLGLVGESGCGKSLTALAVMGLVPERARLLGSIRMGDAEGPFERAAARGEGPLRRAFIGSRLAPITACRASVM